MSRGKNPRQVTRVSIYSVAHPLSDSPHSVTPNNTLFFFVHLFIWYYITFLSLWLRSSSIYLRCLCLVIYVLPLTQLTVLFALHMQQLQQPHQADDLEGDQKKPEKNVVIRIVYGICWNAEWAVNEKSQREKESG